MFELPRDEEQFRCHLLKFLLYFIISMIFTLAGSKIYMYVDTYLCFKKWCHSEHSWKLWRFSFVT
jgi:hypothetical protein